MGKKERGTKGSQGCGESLAGERIIGSLKCQQAGQGRHLLSRPPVPLNTHLFSETKPSCRHMDCLSNCNVISMRFHSKKQSFASVLLLKFKKKNSKNKNKLLCFIWSHRFFTITHFPKHTKGP